MTAWVWILIKMLPHLNWLFSSNISNFRENPFSGSALKLVFFKASQHFSLYENGHFCIFSLFSSTLHSSFKGKHFIVDKKKYVFEFTKQPTFNIAYSLPMNPNFQKWPNVRLPVHCELIKEYQNQFWSWKYAPHTHLNFVLKGTQNIGKKDWIWRTLSTLWCLH